MQVSVLERLWCSPKTHTNQSTTQSNHHQKCGFVRSKGLSDWPIALVSFQTANIQTKCRLNPHYTNSQKSLSASVSLAGLPPETLWETWQPAHTQKKGNLVLTTWSISKIRIDKGSTTRTTPMIFSSGNNTNTRAANDQVLNSLIRASCLNYKLNFLYKNAGQCVSCDYSKAS